jgi:hypothetical protein
MERVVLTTDEAPYRTGTSKSICMLYVWLMVPCFLSMHDCWLVYSDPIREGVMISTS